MGEDESAPRARSLPPGTRIDRYEVGEPLGAGGFGAVYRARHAILGHPVALKVLHPSHRASPDSVDRFWREARAAAAVGSPHIVKVLDCGSSADGEPFIVMELLEGEALQRLLTRAAPLPLDRALGLGLQILDGLEAAHGAGIVHRDLKPANVFVCADPDTPGGDFVKIVDFGISKMRLPEEVRSATKTGVVMGTPSYMAPEQFRGARDVDARADLYSVGVVLYQMLAGRVPHEGASYEDLVVKVCTERPPPLRTLAPGVPPALADAVERGLSRDPDGRWSSAGAFAHALRSAVGDGALVAAPAPVRTVPQPRATPEPLPIAPIAPPAAPPPPTQAGADGPASMTPRPMVLAADEGPRGATTARLPRSTRGAWFAAFAIVLLGGAALVGVVLLASRPDASAPGATGTLGERASAAGASFATAPTKPPKTPDAAPVAAPGVSPAATPLAAVAPLPAVAPRPTVAPSPAVAPPSPVEPAPAPDAPRGVRIGEPRIVGEIPFSPVFRIVRSAAGRLDACRGEAAATVRVQLHLAFGDIPLAAPAPDNHGPAEVARCVASRMAAGFPDGFEPEASGIIFVEVTVPAR